jgi:hypothetical protein
MAGVTVPTVLVVFVLAGFVVLRFGYKVPIPIERGLVFPLAIAPGLWGLWNILYIVLRRHWRIPLGVHGALVPLLVGPLALGNAFLLGFDIPRFVLSIFPVGVAAAMLAYYLVWKYLVGFFNRMLEIG